jgi:hypothetical protein
MNVFLRAVVTGFGFTMGAALYKRFGKKLGIEPPDAEPARRDTPVGDVTDAASDGIDGGDERAHQPQPA